MKKCVATSKKYQAWPKQAEKDFHNIYNAIFEKNFLLLGQIAEANALRMHETIRDTVPSIDFFTNETYELLEKIKKIRKNGIEVFCNNRRWSKYQNFISR